MKLLSKLLALASLSSFSLSFSQSDYCIFQVDDYYTGPIGSNPYQMTPYDGNIIFAGVDPSAGAELLEFNGSTISLLDDIRPGALSSQPNFLTLWEGDLYFAANDGANGTELHKYDGVSVTMVADINPGGYHSFPSGLVGGDGELYFAADDGSTGIELWKFDGIIATQISDINPGGGSSNPTNLFLIGNDLYFSADNGTTGIELYRYNGTTVTSFDMNSGVGSSFPQFFYDWNGILIFSCDDGATGMELYEMDGTTPTMIADIAPGGANGNPIDFVEFQGNLVFRAATIATGSELYEYDGTNVTLIQDILPGALSGFPDNLTVFGTEVVFSVNDGTAGYELWRYNGTTISMVQEIAGGGVSAFSANNAEDFVVAGTTLFFLADNGGNGEEWWVYDGITAKLTKDLYAGSADCNATEASLIGTEVYFTAENGANGLELYKFDTQAQLWDSTIVVTCGSYISPGGQSFSGSGNYPVTDIIPSVSCPGCDSTLHIDLTITSGDLVVNYPVISCGSFISPGGQVFTAVGTYAVSDTFPSILCPGVDSIINIDLEIVQLSNAITQFGGLLIAQASGANYQWLDCDNGYAFIPGANDQDFAPTLSGNYAVEVSIGGCVDTSVCKSVTVVDGIEETVLGSYVLLYPNPALELLTIATELEGQYLIYIMDNSGKRVEMIHANQAITEIGLESLSAGIYFVEVSNDQGRLVRKLVKN